MGMLAARREGQPELAARREGQPVTAAVEMEVAVMEMEVAVMEVEAMEMVAAAMAEAATVVDSVVDSVASAHRTSPDHGLRAGQWTGFCSTVRVRSSHHCFFE